MHNFYYFDSVEEGVIGVRAKEVRLIPNQYYLVNLGWGLLRFELNKSDTDLARARFKRCPTRKHIKR